MLVYHSIWHLKCKLCQYDIANHVRVCKGKKQNDTNSKSGEVLCSFQACFCLAQNGDLTRRRAACVSYINTAMYPCQTEHSVDVPGPGPYHRVDWSPTLTRANFKTHATGVWISRQSFQSKPKFKAQFQGKVDKLGQSHWQKSATLPLSLFAQQQLACWEAGFPCLFFCLIWSQEWLSKRERHTASMSEDGGVVYCFFWRKGCRVTGCTWTFGACRHLVTSFLCPRARQLGEVCEEDRVWNLRPRPYSRQKAVEKAGFWYHHRDPDISKLCRNAFQPADKNCWSLALPTPAYVMLMEFLLF